MRKQRGFTLVELLIYTGIVAIIGTLFGGVLINVTKIQTRQTASSEVNQQLNFAVQNIQRLIRDASVVDIPSGVATPLLKLRVKNETDPTRETPTTISLSGGRIYVTQGAGLPSPITNANVKVDSLTFLKISSYPGHDSVQFDIGISYNNNPNPADKIFSQTLSSAVARVSAATFDSSLLPGAGNNYDIGLDAKRWKDLYLSGRLTLGTLAADPAGSNGMLYYNTTSNKLRGYISGAWTNIGDSIWLQNGSSLYYNNQTGGPGDVTHNVGIGTNNPGSSLTIRQYTNPGPFIEFEGSGGNGATIGMSQISGTPLGIYAQQGLELSVDDGKTIKIGPATDNSSATILLDSGPGVQGSVGIRTSDPEATLHVGCCSALNPWGGAMSTVYVNDGGEGNMYYSFRTDSASANWPEDGFNFVVANTGNSGVGTLDPQAKLDVVSHDVKSANSHYSGLRISYNTNSRTGDAGDNTDLNSFTQHDVEEVSSLITWTTIRTLAPDSIAQLWTRGFIEAHVMGYTATQGSGATFSRWYFDIANGSPSVARVGSDVISGSGPQFRLNVNANNIEMQVQSSDGINAYDGTVDLQMFVPRGGGSGGQAGYHIIN